MSRVSIFVELSVRCHVESKCLFLEHMVVLSADHIRSFKIRR